MTERPILFSAPMVSALLAGTKTQTRRICKLAQFFSLSSVVEVPDPQERGQVYNGSHFGDEDGEVQFACPYGGRGDRLWVRETWAWSGDGAVPAADRVRKGEVWFRADPERSSPAIRWRPSIHMPRWASRITLEVTGVRVERVQDISEADALAEGVNVHPDHHGKPRTSIYSPVQAYRDLWEQINGPDSWDANPYVWVVEFKRVEGGAA